MEEIDKKIETLEASISELASAIKGLAAEVKETRQLTSEMKAEVQSQNEWDEYRAKQFNRAFGD